jgi:hypothetical protein
MRWSDNWVQWNGRDQEGTGRVLPVCCLSTFPFLFYSLFFLFLTLFSSQLCRKVRVFVIFCFDSSIYEQELPLLCFKRKGKGFCIHTQTDIYISPIFWMLKSRALRLRIVGEDWNRNLLWKCSDQRTWCIEQGITFGWECGKSMENIRGGWNWPSFASNSSRNNLLIVRPSTTLQIQYISLSEQLYMEASLPVYFCCLYNTNLMMADLNSRNMLRII